MIRPDEHNKTPCWVWCYSRGNVGQPPESVLVARVERAYVYNSSQDKATHLIDSVTRLEMSPWESSSME